MTISSARRKLHLSQVFTFWTVACVFGAAVPAFANSECSVLFIDSKLHQAKTRPTGDLSLKTIEPTAGRADFVELTDPSQGSQGGKWFRESSIGKKYFGKDYSGNTERVLAEHLSARIYDSMGVRVSNTVLKLINGRLYILSSEIKGAHPSSVAELQKSDFTERFIIDAWLANRDVTGLTLDNVLINQDGKSTRIDPAGALLWRAMGGSDKPFSTPVIELESMRNPQFVSGRVFSALSEAQIAGQIRQFALLYSMRRPNIFGLIEKSGLSKPIQQQLKTALDQRARWIVTEGLSKYDRQQSDDIEHWAVEYEEGIGRANFARGTTERDLNKQVSNGIRFTVAEQLALENYFGFSYLINSTLWGSTYDWQWLSLEEQTRYRFEAVEPQIRLIRSALAKLPDFKGSVTRYIDLNEAQIARYVDGSDVTEMGFVSATNRGKPPFALKPPSVLMFIQSEKGKDVSRLSFREGENEVLFPPGTRFRVEENFQRGSRHYISLIEIPD